MRFNLMIFSGLAAMTFCATNASSSLAQLTDKQRSVVAIDVYVDRLASSEMAKSTGVDSPNGPLPVNPDNPIKPEEIRRVFGAASAPPKVQSIQSLGGDVDQLDFDFFLRIQFVDAKSAETAFAEMSKDAVAETVGGKEYFRFPDGSKEPRNILFHRLSPDVVEIGSDDYIKLADRNVFSNNLMAAWKKMPQAAIRVALDLDGSRHLIDEALQMTEGQVPPMAQPALSMINNMSVLRIGLDFSSDSLLWLTATGRDDSATGQIDATLGGLLAMAKGMGQQSLPMAGPDAQGPGGELLAALVTQVDGNDVNIVLPRPDGLEKAIGGIFMQMMTMDSGPPMDADSAEMLDPSGAAPAGPTDDPFGGGADPFGADGGDGGAEMAPAGAADEAKDDPFGGDGADPFGS